MAQNDPYLYFLYSDQQHEERKNLEAQMCRTFVPGVIIVNGIRKRFTEMSTKSSSAIYPDSKVIAEGYKSKMKYTAPMVVSAKR